MATDLTNVLINRHLAKINRGTIPDVDLSGSQFTAGNNQQMISQGIGNFLGYINAPEARQEAARQDLIAAEQTAYDRSLDAQNQGRADARLKLSQAAETRQANREKKQDLATTAQNQFQALAFQLGDDVRSASEANQGLMADLESRGLLVQDAQGVISLSPNASAEDVAAFESRQDVDELSKSNRQQLLKYVADMNADNISGNEVGNIQAGIQMFDNAWQPSTTATKAENDAFTRKRAKLQAERDEDLRKTTGAIGNDPELLSMTSELASVTDGDFSTLGDDLVVKAIDANSRLDKDALGEVQSWVERVNKGKEGKTLQNQAKDTARFEYALAKVIQRSGGDVWIGAGDFNDSTLAREVAAQLARIDQVDTVVREQGEIQSKYASDILRAEALYNAKTSGRVQK